ncbi:MAG: IPT/TIG domain-containing protein [Chloroflexi bacterium]|nr:IPT/TIG domain-containing protein [Chloroflexota bacterium]
MNPKNLRTLILGALIIGYIFLGGLNSPTPVIAQGPTVIQGIPVVPTSSATINFAELAKQHATTPSTSEPGVNFIAPFMQAPEPTAIGQSAQRTAIAQPVRPSVASPAPALNYMGMDDIAAVGSTLRMIPPDTDGAVGPTRVFVTLNNNYRVQDKTTGATVSTVSMNTFWAGTGATGNFDPKTLYDPYNNRFIVAGVSNVASPSSSIVYGVSDTSDPNGTWKLYRYIVGATIGGVPSWADYPTMGFNKNWVAISVNMFGTTDGLFKESRMLVINYPNLLAGAPTGTLFTGLSDFAVQPAVTYSATENTLYAPAHWNSSAASYRLNTITGTPASPLYTQGVLKTNSLGAWTVPSGDIQPQAPEPVTGATAKINAGDARILNAVFRNGNIWYAQTVGLPAGGIISHLAAQWVKLDTSGNFVDGGRVEDPTATVSNGGKWYSYPTITVNKNNDVLLGFSQFSSSQYAAAGYAYRQNTDAAGTMRDPYIYKAGEGYYYKTYSGTRNRWGDYSNTQVDPSNDTDLWTIQEYAKPQVGTGNGSGIWSTWWAKVAIGAPPTITGLSPFTTAPGGLGFTLTVTGTNYIASSIVRWNGADRTTIYVNSTQLTANILAGDIATPGIASVTVYNPDGTGTSNPANFYIGPPAKHYLPVISKSSP